MKTTKEFLEQLPEPCRTQAISQLDEYFSHETAIDINDAILGFQYWRKTNEGFSYWRNINKLAKSGAFDSDPSETVIKFIDYIQNNLNVWLEFEKMALNLIDKGHDHYSARTIVHVLRYQTHVGEFKSKYKINDHVSPMFARIFILIHPEHEGFFKIKNR